MSDGPTGALVVHVNRREQDAGGDLRLGPACAVVGGDQDMAALAHHHEPRAGRRAVKQQGFGRQRRPHCLLGSRCSRREKREQEHH